MVKHLLTALTLIALATTLQAQKKDPKAKDPLPKLNTKVLKYAQDHKGKQVGNGECWTLAAEALADAGAQRPGYDGVPVTVFGKKLEEKETILPGDVVQFDKAKFKVFVNGGTGYMMFPQHTAIVAKVEGKKITLLQSNVNNKKTVEPGEIRLDLRIEGTVEFFRPQLPTEK